MMNSKIISWAMLLSLSSLTAAASAPTAIMVYAQVPPTTAPTLPTSTVPSDPAVNAILDATKTTCIEKGVRQCMNVDYQSASLVAINGESLLPSGATIYGNFYIWEAVDKLRSLGFQIDAVTTAGAGTEANPSVLYVVMSK